MDEKTVLTVAEMMKCLNISHRKAYELIHEPGFPVLRIGRAVRIPKAALISWIERKAAGQ